jgi:thiol-disulfide isomerase/thioredoxin
MTGQEHATARRSDGALRLGFVGMLAFALILLTACAADSGATSAPTAPSISASAPEQVTESVESSTPESLDFSGTTLEGVNFRGADLAGKPVVMWFWAPWCTVCRAEAPDVAQIAKEFGGEVAFVGIAGRGPVEDMQAFVQETATGGFTHVADVDGSLWARFGVVAQPSFVFVTPSGEAETFTGGMDAAELRDVANELLAS